MDPLTLSLLSGAAGGGGEGSGGNMGALSMAATIPKTAFGLYQMIKGAKLAKENVRPEYEIPEEIKANLSDAQRLALEGMPAEQKKQYVDNIQRSSQMGLRALGDRKSGVAGVAGVVQNQNDAFRNLLAMDSEQRLNNIRTLMGTRQNMAQYRDKEFGINEMEPYLDKARTAEAMKGAGLQNIFGGISEGVQTAQDADIYKRLLGSDNIPVDVDTTQTDPLQNPTNQWDRAAMEQIAKMPTNQWDEAGMSGNAIKPTGQGAMTPTGINEPSINLPNSNIWNSLLGGM